MTAFLEAIESPEKFFDWLKSPSALTEKEKSMVRKRIEHEVEMGRLPSGTYVPIAWGNYAAAYKAVYAALVAKGGSTTSGVDWYGYGQALKAICGAAGS